MTIKASKAFSFKNQRGNIETLQENDEVFTYVDSNTERGKTFVIGKIMRPVFVPQPPIKNVLNAGTENETTQEIPQPDVLSHKTQIGEFVTNDGKPHDINWVDSDYAQKCENAIISELQLLPANDGIVFTSSILGA